MIHVQGQVTGQINGLTQIDLGDYRFGSPVRISAILPVCSMMPPTS